MSEELALFGAEVLADDPFDGYPIGSYWQIKYDRGDGENHTAKGVIVRHKVWDNQWRLDQYREYADRGIDVPQWFRDEEYQEEPQLVLYTGYSFGEGHWGTRIWISRIKKARRLFGADVEGLHEIWQQQHDRWARNDVKHAEWWSHEDAVHVGWAPSRYQGPCDHKIWRTTKPDRRYEVVCVCGEVIASGEIDGEPCMWWWYIGSMGNDRIWTPHPDDCHWCDGNENDPEQGGE